MDRQNLAVFRSPKLSAHWLFVSGFENADTMYFSFVLLFWNCLQSFNLFLFLSGNVYFETAEIGREMWWPPWCSVSSRYVAICHPMRAQTMSSLPRAIKVILLIWIVSGICSIPMVLQFDVVYIQDASGKLSQVACRVGEQSPGCCLQISQTFVETALHMWLVIRQNLVIASFCVWSGN